MAVGYNGTIIYHQDSEKGAINWFRQRILEQGGDEKICEYKH